MEGLLLPICSIFFSILLCIIYFSKKRINSLENKIFSVTLLCSVVDSIIVSILQYLALNNINDIELITIEWLNKIDFIILIAYATCIFIYTCLITIPKVKTNFKKIIKSVSGLGIVAIILVLIGSVTVITQGTKTSVTGSSTIITYVTAGIYLLLSILIVLINIKKTDKRHIPIYSIIGISLLLILFFNLNPYLIVVSITLTFLNFLMYFTIENPDVKMIEELNKSKERIEQLKESKNIFYSDFSHKIRVPINDIIHSAVLIKESNDDPSTKKNSEDIITSSQKLLDLINEVFRVTKIDDIDNELLNSEYNIKEECRKIIESLNSELQEKEIELIENYSQNIPEKLYGDKDKIRLAIITLLRNSIDHTSKGKIELKIDAEILEEKCSLSITISDTGTGIEKEKLNKIFNEISEPTNSDGTINIVVVNKLIKLMGGFISIKSEMDEGTKITLHLKQNIIK